MSDDRRPHDQIEDDLVSLDPEVRTETARYEPLVRNLSLRSLIALRIVSRQEMERRARELRPTGRIGR